MDFKEFKEKIRHQLKDVEPKEYDLEFDFCMKCGRRMPDKKYTTYKKHQDEAHPIKNKKKIKYFFFKHTIISLVILMAVVIGLLHFVVTPSLDILFPTELYLTDDELVICREDILKIKQEISESGDFTLQHTDEFNRLLHECNVDFFGQIRNPPIFEDEAYRLADP